MNILVLNSGSSSLKYKLFDMDSQEPMAWGLVERIGGETGELSYTRRLPGETPQTFTQQTPVADHDQALRLAAEWLTSPDHGAVSSTGEIHGIGHRIVHGGESFSAPTVLDEAVIDRIRANVPLAPLHNPAGLDGVRVAAELFPGAPMVAVFDTAFHQSAEPKVYMYPLPRELYEKHGVRRYGFHGTSHHYVAKRAAQLLGRDFADTSVVTVHLGNGCSVTAIENGRCVETSMGMTPLAGLMMGARCGDVDPAIHGFLSRNLDMDIETVTEMMNTKSGLKGICGYNDMRDIHARRKQGDAWAELALDMFTHRVKHFIGACLAALQTCQAIVFTAGIGENDPEVRRRSCATLGWLGATLDPHRNETAPKGRAAEISAADSPIRILVIPTDEELEIAVQTAETLRS